MNKILIAIGVLIILGVGGFFLFERNVKSIYPQAQNQQNTYVTPSSANNIEQNNNTDKAQLDKDLEKELDQLDQDIKKGSKDSINDSDFNF